MPVTRTFGKLHFDDLDPRRFEDLCLSIIYRMRRWEKIENFGRTGKDDAIDINAVERLENGKRDVWHFQCKRYEKLKVSDIRAIIKDYCSRNADRPDYYFIIAGCDVSKTVRDCLLNESEKNGFKTVGIWAASELEAKLYAEHHDLLFAFFGVNMSDDRNNRIGSIRRNVALKKRMQRDFKKEKYTDDEIKAIRSGDYFRKFKHSCVLVRSIYDKSYPDNSLLDEPGTGHFRAEVFNWYHNGLMVRCNPYAVQAKVRYADSVKEQKLETVGCIPYENIIEYDMDGDEFNNYPHLYCDFMGTDNPFEAIKYFSEDGFEVYDEYIVEIVE